MGGGSGLRGYRRASAERSTPHARHTVVADPRGLQSMNSRQRRGVILLVLSVLCALAAFAGVLSVIT